jgi:predicted MFS family arabinose efflux permease
MHAATPPSEQDPQDQKLWTAAFISLNAVMFLAFCNMAVFFELFRHLRAMAMSAEVAGLVIAVFSLSVLIVRPLISPWLRPGNARLWIAVGTAGDILALLLYPWAHGALALGLLRVFHGLAYVVMGTAGIAALTGCIPPNKSGQAFGMIGVVTLLPYAVVPPLVDPVSKLVGGYMELLALTALLMLPTFPLLIWAKPTHSHGASGEGRLRLKEIAANLKDLRISSLLVAYLFLIACFSAVFYFVEGFARSRGIAGAGLFFTFATLAEIAARLLLGPWTDRTSKPAVMLLAGLWLSACLLALTLTHGEVSLLLVATAYGLGWGLLMPVVNAMVFELSPPRLRALNTNLAMESFQGGFMLGPLLGGVLIGGVGFGALFLACAGLCLAVTLALWLILRHRYPRPAGT